LNKHVKRILQYLRHYEFRTRLQAKCEEYKCNLHLVDEYYTSKTCCTCKTQNNTLGRSKGVVCKNVKCKMKIDRDINGAINILNVGIQKCL
jgi:putative transposase